MRHEKSKEYEPDGEIEHRSEMGNETRAFQEAALNLISAFIEFVRKSRKTKANRDCKAAWSPERYYHDLSSLKIGLPRRSGNTTLACKILKKYPRSIYATATQDLSEGAWLKMGKKKYGHRIFCSSSLIHSTGENPNIIVTDCSDYFLTGDLDKIYRAFSRADPIYIHIGI